VAMTAIAMAVTEAGILGGGVVLAPQLVRVMMTMVVHNQ